MKAQPIILYNLRTQQIPVSIEPRASATRSRMTSGSNSIRVKADNFEVVDNMHNFIPIEGCIYPFSSIDET